MRTVIIAVVSALVSAAFTVGVMWAHHSSQQMNQEVDFKARIAKVQVDAFNDGFLDGLCRDGEDGNGHPCK